MFAPRNYIKCTHRDNRWGEGVKEWSYIWSKCAYFFFSPGQSVWWVLSMMRHFPVPCSVSLEWNETSSKHKYTHSSATQSNSIMTGVQMYSIVPRCSLVGKPWVQDCSCMWGGRNEPGNTSCFQWVLSWTCMSGEVVWKPFAHVLTKQFIVKVKKYLMSSWQQKTLNNTPS